MDTALVELVWKRARGCCEYCQMPQAYDELAFEIDHIIAVQHGGRTVAGNLALASRRGRSRDSFIRVGIPGIGTYAGTDPSWSDAPPLAARPLPYSASTIFTEYARGKS